MSATDRSTCPLLARTGGHAQRNLEQGVWHAVTIQQPGRPGDKLGGEVTPWRPFGCLAQTPTIQ